MKYGIYFLFLTLIFSTAFSQKAKYQKGYVKKNGAYVQPHFKTESNKTNHDNYSTKPNSNPFTSKTGSRAKDYSPDANNFGKNKTIYKGPQGGNYYKSDKNKKTYVPKRY